MAEDLLEQRNIPVFPVMPIAESFTHGMGTDWIIDADCFGSSILNSIGLDPG